MDLGGYYDETTNEIGSKYNTKVLASDESISQTNNEECRWYGLYYVQRNSNVEGNGNSVQTNMIWGQQWNAMISYFGSKSIDYSAFGTTSGVVNCIKNAEKVLEIT